MATAQRGEVVQAIGEIVNPCGHARLLSRASLRRRSDGTVFIGFTAIFGDSLGRQLHPGRTLLLEIAIAHPLLAF